MESLGHSINSSGLEQKYLNMKTIPEYQPVERIAYVHDITLGTTKLDVGFATFILKDVNSNLVTARLFDLEDFMLSGYKAANFKHKPVIFTCTAQEYRGQISLVIDKVVGISVYDGEFDAQRFIGRMEYDLSPIRDTANKECPELLGVLEFSAWEDFALEQLCSGKLGGFAKYAETVFASIKPYFSDDYRQDLMRCFLVSMEYYFKYLCAKEKDSAVGEVFAYEFLNAITVRFSGSDMKNLYLDCFGALIGIHKPMHLFSHLLQSASIYAKNTIRLVVRFDSIPFGSKVPIGTGGVELSNY